MANVITFSPGYYPSPIIGRPIPLAKIYIGEPDTDPEIAINQKQVSALQEDTTIVPIPQPIRTNAGGVPEYNGSPVTLLVNGFYSMKVLNALDVQRYYIPGNGESESVILLDSVEDMETSTVLQIGDIVETVARYSTQDGGGAKYKIVAAGTGTDDGIVFIDLPGSSLQAQLIWDQKNLDLQVAGLKLDGTTDDTTQFLNALNANSDGVSVYCKKSNIKLTSTIVMPNNCEIDLGGSTVFVDVRGKTGLYNGFLLGSNCTLKNIGNGYIKQDQAVFGDFIACGLFYGIGNSTRALYIGIVPDITTINDASNWDAPTDILIEKCHSDLTGISYTTEVFGFNFILLTNFVKRITIRDIKVVGNVTWVDYATSYVTTAGGVLNNSNYLNAVRFEWGNLVTPLENASGESIIVENVYGEALRLQNHSAVVAMGNAHSFEVTNVTGFNTGQVFFCGSSGVHGDAADQTAAYETTMRNVKNVKGRSLYTWPEGTHFTSGISVDDIFDNSEVLSSQSNVIIDGFTLIGKDSDVTAPTNYPTAGVLIGDATWNVDTRYTVLRNGRASNFDTGILLQNAKRTTLDNIIASYNGNRGFSIGAPDTSITGHIIKNCYSLQNNLDGYTSYTTNSGVGVSIFRALGVTFDSCVFGDDTLPAGSETQLHSIFLRDGAVRNVKFRDCKFVNYESASSFDIYVNSVNITIATENCLSAINSDGLIKTNAKNAGYDFKLMSTGKFNYAGATLTQTDTINCVISRAATGRYLVTFDNALRDTSYYPIPIASGDTASFDYHVQYSNINTTSFEILVRNSGGAFVDPSSATQNIGFVVFDAIDMIQQINI